MGNLCTQLLLKFNADYFETSQVFLSENVLVPRYNPQIIICHFPLHVELRSFSRVIPIKVYGQGVPCLGNFYNFTLF